MPENQLALNEQKLLVLILKAGGSVSEKEVKEVLEWDDVTIRKVRASLFLKKLVHILTPDIQFGENGRTQALKIEMELLFPSFEQEERSH